MVWDGIDLHDQFDQSDPRVPRASGEAAPHVEGAGMARDCGLFGSVARKIERVTQPHGVQVSALLPPPSSMYTSASSLLCDGPAVSGLMVSIKTGGGEMTTQRAI